MRKKEKIFTSSPTTTNINNSNNNYINYNNKYVFNLFVANDD
jgi:hypothetical protein